uniref:RWP-RK domain-containing protein n=1 Tax=Fagus sylvatica TaxID=28930 RepID=A0A2N9H073_FAGSY
MGNQSQTLNGWWSNSKHELVCTDHEDPFLFPSQMPSLDLSAYSSLDWQYEMPLQEGILDVVPLTASFPTDPLYATLDLEPTTTLTQDDLFFDCGNRSEFWNEIFAGLEPRNQALVQSSNNDEGKEVKEERKTKRCREERSSSSRMLSRKTISQYFYMPITQAAKELNVGLTLLKKRCRELGIRRWPHRKLMSLQTLIKNVQEIAKEEGEDSEGKLRNAIQILESERKLLEEVPDMQLEDNTKRLRQACFKANYKKRKLMGMVDSQSCSSSNPASMDGTSNEEEEEDEDEYEEEEMKSLLLDPFSASCMRF